MNYVTIYSAPGGLLRFSRPHIFPGFCVLHRVQLAFAFACGRQLLERRTSITPRIEAFPAIEDSVEGNSTLSTFYLIYEAELQPQLTYVKHPYP
jgi:hypothetical protein